MLLAYVLGLLYATAAEHLVEEAQPQPHCNCAPHLLHVEETTTEVSPTFPTTSFTCWDRYDGYYADIEVDCTIFHYCQTWHFPTGLNETVKWDFACPKSTIFNQKILSCTPPNISFDCQESPNYYWVNYNLKSTSTTPVPTTEYTTPVPNIKQQLIVGGLVPQSVDIPGTTRPPTPMGISSPVQESGSDSEQPPGDILSGESDSSTIRFPL